MITDSRMPHRQSLTACPITDVEMLVNCISLVRIMMICNNQLPATIVLIVRGVLSYGA